MHTKRRCRACGAMMSAGHECYKKYCSKCIKNKEKELACYMSPLSNRSASSEKVFYVFHDFETTHNMAWSEKSFLHVLNYIA